MRVHLTTPVYDINGAVAIDVLPTTELGDVTRRMNRTQTLDGGVAVNDYGHSEADRTITLRWRTLDREAEANIIRLVKSYGLLNVSTRDGLFSAAPETYRNTANESSLILLVKEKL
jgi:hypothetical protein